MINGYGIVRFEDTLWPERVAQLVLPCEDANDNNVVKNTAEAGGGNLVTTPAPVSWREQLREPEQWREGGE